MGDQRQVVKERDRLSKIVPFGKDAGELMGANVAFPNLESLSVREERARIARELHDTLLQTFLGALLQLGVAVDSLPFDSPVKSKLSPILGLIEQGMEEGRNAIQGLRSYESHGVDLVRAFSELQQEIDVQSEIDFRVTVIGRKQALRSRIATEVYRIGREALVNAFRHSGAKRVELELQYGITDLCMRVRDDGRGIDPRVLDADREGHWGLTGMRERAARIAALLKISSSAADGTQVQLSVPDALDHRHSGHKGVALSRDTEKRFSNAKAALAGSNSGQLTTAHATGGA